MTDLYKQADAPIDERVADLLGRMTLEEKIAQLHGKTTLFPVLQKDTAPAFGIVGEDGAIDEGVAASALPDSVGSFFLLAGPTAQHEAEMVNTIQHWIVERTRLGIPALFHCEGLHGASLGGATTFPQSIGLGSSWDRELIERVFDATRKELRAVGMNVALAPVLDLARDPRYGRTEEMYSEDAFLTGELGVHAVRGLQGAGEADPAQRLLAVAKHFVHGSPQNGTNVGPNDVSERTMRELYLLPFERAVQEADLRGVMSSYNENDGGLPTTANPWLQQQVLRAEWGFTGLTVSDFGAVERLVREQHVAATLDEAGVLAFGAGLDVEMPGREGFGGLLQAVRSGRLDAALIDAAVSRVLTEKFALGLFEQPYVDIAAVAEVVGNAEHGALARRAADESAVLLKNEGGLLPLDADALTRIAVIGPNADKIRIGTYAGTPPYFVTVLEGIRSLVGDRAEVVFAQGVAMGRIDGDPTQNKITAWEPAPYDEDTAHIAQAVEVARDADVVILALGGNENVSNEAFGGLMQSFMGGLPVYGDTDDLELPGRQNELVREIGQLGKPVVAVVLNGRPFSFAQLAESVPAILEGWYGGQESGNAIAGILFGDVNPSGRLPVTIARNAGQLPVFYDRKPAARLGYVFEDNAPLFPFGFGLGYTEFAYGEPVLDRAEIDRDGTARVSVEVTNTGGRAGAEVVQLYVHPRVSTVVQPVLRLAGFERITLESGERRTVTFEVGPAQLAVLDNRMRRTVEPGDVDVLVGRDADDLTAVTLRVTAS